MALAGSLPLAAGAGKITIGWAAWDPANALVELSKDFTAKTGIEVGFEFVPWPNFADRMLNELNSHSDEWIVVRRQSVDWRFGRERTLCEAQ